MVQSAELLMDSETDTRIRQEWERLRDAGLPSQARHTGRSNRPHITLGIARSLTPQQEDDLARCVDELPQPLRLGGPLLFGSGPFVLARAVVPTVELLLLQQRVVAAMGPGADPFAGQQVAGRWTGHVTLARRLEAGDLERALETLAPLHDIDATAIRLRRWDGDRKIEWPVRPVAGTPVPVRLEPIPDSHGQARLGN